jgi:hypothetical protein
VLTIWFNRTYATHAHLFSMLRDNPDDVAVRLLASHTDGDSPILAAADVAFQEPDPGLTRDEYVAWALAFCAEHGVDVFVPRQHLLAIAEARTGFEASGVAVVAPPAVALRLLDDKAAAYRDAEAAGLAVPPFRVVRDARSLRAAYDELATLGDVCVKPVHGVGGLGYRRLTEQPLSFSEVLEPVSHRVAVADMINAVQQAEGSVPDLMVLPYLPGPEVSVDCLGDPAGKLAAAIPRSKIGRTRRLVDDPDAIAVARTVVERHRLVSLSNTQVRYWKQPGVDAHSVPYLLETNARAAAGIYQTVLSGSNLIWSAVRIARGLAPNVAAPSLGARYATLSGLAPSVVEGSDPDASGE